MIDQPLHDVRTLSVEYISPRGIGTVVQPPDVEFRSQRSAQCKGRELISEGHRDLEVIDDGQ